MDRTGDEFNSPSMMASSHQVKGEPPGSVRRCAGCGQRLAEPLPTACPLCGFHFGDTRPVGLDVSPYALAYSHGEHAWRAMAEWVWFAGTERIKHLALMQSSAASRRFACANTLLLSLAAGVFLATMVGGYEAPASSAVGRTTPGGFGWIMIASAPRPLPTDLPPELKVDLWWNLANSTLALAVGLVAGLLLLALTLSLIRAALLKAHDEKYRQERRMTAALHYSTAWLIPIAVAMLLVCITPLSIMGRINHWPWYPPREAILLASAVIAGLGIILWWFWLVRLGFTAPASCRSRVTLVAAVLAPTLAAAAAAGWWYGLSASLPLLFQTLRMDF